ncbi:hypothetical protein BLNAU_10929 [Blattamonas nauphoetae]|uniref:Uncharacterized protein n=1 Tax=Blattamonas nauphoetae TaxID=2049346 RepID=A0ABQ9XNW7_9EUKA|nr:hypothetical protein BLNAU_10929 [Blattamonas nauphoetae]
MEMGQPSFHHQLGTLLISHKIQEVAILETESKNCRISFSFSRTPRHGYSSLATISSSSVKIYESRVISNSERTPFVVVGENGWEETSITSPSDVDVAQNVEIASHGLWIRDASLIVGTGPLFDFCGFGSQLEREETCFVKTTLSSSCILNTTSDFMGTVARERKEQDGGSDVGLVSGVSQSLIGSCVRSCTNHLYGTAIHDLNLGGSVLSQNTSFTHTTTTLDYHNEHKTQQTQLTTQNVLHRFSLCTFKNCYAGGSAGAIPLFYIEADLEIESCSFDNCSAGFGGGAVGQSTPRGESIFTLLSSSHHISEFELNRWWRSDDDISMEYTIVRRYHFELSLPELSEFRECTSSSNTGYDLFFYTSNAQTYPLPTGSLVTVSNCDSTSTPEENRIYPTNIVSRTVLPTPSQTATIQSLTAQLAGSTEAEMAVILNKAVSGRLLVLVSNAQGKSRTDKSKAPNIDRVLAFTLSSLDVGQMAVSIGETGLLQQSLEDYRIGAASLSGYNVSFSTTPITVVTLNPTLLSANCVLDESHTKAVLNLEGSDVDGETFVFTLHDKSTFEASFASSKASVTLGLIGENSKWKENMMFVIVSGKKKNSDSISVSIPTPCFFTIPEGPRLTNIEVSELNEDKTGVSLSYTSRQLKGDEDFEVTIQKVGGDETEVMKLSTNAEGQIISQTVVLFPSGSNTEGWKNWIVFGESYEVVGVLWKRLGGDVAVQFSSIVFDMPVEVFRVSSAECSKDSATSTIVSVVGVGFVVDETYTLTLSGTPTSEPTSSDIHAPTITVKASTRTAAQSSPLSLSSTSDSALRFGFTYEITNIMKGSEAGVVDGGQFDTSEPLVISITCDLKDGDAKTIEISISGSNIPDGQYNLVLKKTGSSKETELPIKFVGSEGSVEFALFSSSEMEYEAKYEVTRLFNSLVTVALPKEATDRSLTMPDTPARVMSASCELSGELKTFAKIVISGENLPSGKTLSVKVKQVDATGSLIGSVIELAETEIASDTMNTKPIEMKVFEVNELCLEYGKTYELISLTISDTASTILDESVRFSVPCAPVRITSASSTDTNPNWTVVTVGGSGLIKDETYTLTLSGKSTTNPGSLDVHGTTIAVVASSPTEAKSAPLPLSSTTESSLLFGHTYTITAITNGTLNGIIIGTPSFTTHSAPAQPSLITANCVLDESLTKAVLNLEGSDVDGETFVFTLHDKSTFEASFASSKASVTLGLIGENSKWKENMMFVIVSGKKKNSDSISVSIPTPCFFTIPEGPRLTNIEVSELNEDKTGVSLSYTSRQLKGDEDFEVTIQKVGGDETEVMKLSTNAEGQIISQTVVLFPSGSNTEGWKNWIVFGESYEVVGVLWKRLGGDVAVQFSSIVFDMPVEVFRVSSAECSKDSATSTIVSVVGVGFVVDETYTLTLSGTPTSEPTSSDIHAPTITVKASTRTAAQSSPLSLSSTSDSALRFGFTWERL